MRACMHAYTLILKIQLVFHIHGFHICGFNQQQIEDICGEGTRTQQQKCKIFNFVKQIYT